MRSAVTTGLDVLGLLTVAAGVGMCVAGAALLVASAVVAVGAGLVAAGAVVVLGSALAYRRAQSVEELR